MIAQIAGCRNAAHVLLAGVLGLVLASPAVAQASSPFASGHGINIPGAVLAKRITPNAPAVYQLQPERWSLSLLREVKASGFGFIRLVTTPAPLMTNDAAALGHALTWIGTFVDQANAAGLSVIVDLHPWPTDGQWDQDQIIADPAHRAALGRAQVALARMLATKTNARVAFELLNEPPCLGPDKQPVDWQAIQLSMERAVRAAAAALPLMLTGCRGLPDQLAAIDAAPYAGDPHIYWTFHYYKPSIFVFQQQNGLEDIPFPPDPSLANSPAGLHAMIPLTKFAAHPGALSAVRAYLSSDRGEAAIAEDLDAIAVWAKRSHIGPDHIFVGEFGTSTTTKNQDLAQVHASDLRWIGAVRRQAERHGFAWTFWTLPSPTNPTYDPRTGLFNADTLRAFGLAGGG